MRMQTSSKIIFIFTQGIKPDIHKLSHMLLIAMIGVSSTTYHWPEEAGNVSIIIIKYNTNYNTSV